MPSTKIIEVPNHIVGERVGLGPDDDNYGTITEIKGTRAKVEWTVTCDAYRKWYGLDELVALPDVSIGDRVGFHSIFDPNPGTVTEIEGSRSKVKWDRPIDSNRWYRPAELVVLPTPVPRFKVGDRVDLIPESKPWLGMTITNVTRWSDGTFSYSCHHPSLGYCIILESRLRHSVVDQHIVCMVQNGQPLPSRTPFIHGDRDAAVTEAQRLAKRHLGVEFAVFHRVAVAMEKP